MLGALGFRAVPHDGRTDPVDAHVLRAAWLVMGPHLLANDGLLPHRSAAAAELLGPRQAEQPLLGERAAERLRHRKVGRVVGESAEEIRRDVRVHQRSEFAAQPVGGLTELVVHRRQASGSWTETTPFACTLSSWFRTSTSMSATCTRRRSSRIPVTTPLIRVASPVSAGFRYFTSAW